MNEGLTSRQIEQIDGLLARAAGEGRQHLFEHEVYGILQALGLQVPTTVFLRDPDELASGMLGEFGTQRLILKVVSGDIPHKTRVGGVASVVRDRERIRGRMQRMQQAILAHPLYREHKPKIEGFLLSSVVEYSKDLGNEVLIGIKENRAFGPEISFSKGGTDAEHFARYFSAPNVRLLPLSRTECRDLLGTTGIIRKWREENHLGYAELIAEAIFRLNLLFTHYSSLNPQPPAQIFSEFEINPLVIDFEEQLIAIDGLAHFLPSTQRLDLASGPNPKGLDSVFWPTGIAVVGVSATDRTKTGNNIATLLHKMKRQDIYLVNVKGGDAVIADQTYSLYKSLLDIPARIDLVVVTVPAPLAPAVAKEAKAKGAKGIVLIPGGFSEVQGDRTLESQIMAEIASTGIRVIGPNCLGVFHAPTARQPGLNTLFIPEEKLEYRPKLESNVALLTQSGALGVTELDALKNAIYPRAVVSYGNQLDVDPGDLAAFFQNDPDIDVLAFYIEGFKTCGGRKFFDAVRQSRKPVIVYKAGRTDAGSRAAASHTASMTGDYKVALAAMEQAGAIVADHIRDHQDLIKIFALMGDREIGGRRVAGVVNAGFESTYAADNIGGLELAEFTPETQAQLRAALPPFVAVNPFLDLTPMADDALFERCIELVLADANVDCLFISIVPHTVMLHTSREEIERDRENIAYRIIRQSAKSRKPVVVSINAGTMYNVFVETVEEGGVPTYTTAERAMMALNRLVEYRLKRESRP
jgi:3-hydroxypropionyl-CoA synthetase (ADP-forming)